MHLIFEGNTFVLGTKFYIYSSLLESVVYSSEILKNPRLEDILNIANQYPIKYITFLGKMPIFNEIAIAYKNTEVEIKWQ